MLKFLHSSRFCTAILLACVATTFASSYGAEANWTIRNKPRNTITVIAHRGAGDLAPENCLSSLEFSWKLGAIPEVDVRQTKDGRIVMFHDGNFKRILPNPSSRRRRSPI